jgi:hypothetical protein
VRRKRDRADELLEQLDHFRLAGNFSIQKRTHSRYSQDATDSEMATGLPLALRRKDRLELFFQCRGPGQAFDDHVVQGDSGDRV